MDDSSRPVAFVTGASSGIGRETALLFARSGYRVFATVRTDAAAASLRRVASGLALEALTLDLLDEAATGDTVRTVVDRAGRIDVIVNNAGYAQLGAIGDLSRDANRRQFEVNVFAAIQIAREALPTMRVQHSGCIVNVSSIAGRVSVPFVGAYCASKFALEAFSDALRLEVRPDGIRVLLIEPGPVATRFQEALRWSRSLLPAATAYSRFYDEALAEPMPRFAVDPERVARVILGAVRSPSPRARYRIRVTEEFLAGVLRLIPTGALDWGIARWYGLNRRAP